MRKARSSFVPRLFRKFSGYYCHLLFEKFVNKAIEKGTELKGKDIVAKSSENCTSVKIGCLEFLDSYNFLDASMDKLSTTLLSFPFIVANGIEDDVFEGKLTQQFEKGQSFESLYEPLKLGREDYFSTLKQSIPNFEETMTQVIV